MTVKNYQDEKLGKVEDIAVDVESGRIVQVILSTGGFIGVGDTLTAVPPGALHHDVARKILHLDADKAKLTDAPNSRPRSGRNIPTPITCRKSIAITARTCLCFYTKWRCGFQFPKTTRMGCPTPIQPVERMGHGTRTATQERVRS